jgi:hypothetical protein
MTVQLRRGGIAVVVRMTMRAGSGGSSVQRRRDTGTGSLWGFFVVRKEENPVQFIKLIINNNKGRNPVIRV